MAYSTKTWTDGAGNEPSVADFNAYIRDVLLPSCIIDIDVFNGAKSHVNWNTNTIDAGTTRVYNCARESSGAQNDAVVWDVSLAAGAWAVDLLHHQGAANGIYSVRLDGVQIGTIDGYGVTQNVQGATVGAVVQSAGVHELSLVMATKNASATNYYGSISALRIRSYTTLPGITPKTWTAAVVTRADLNDYVRDLAAPPVRFDLDVFLPPTAQTNWSTLTVDGGNNLIYQGTKDSSGAQNASISWDLILPGGGTWRVDLLYQEGPDAGIFSVRIDGVEQGAIDAYQAGTWYNVPGSVTGISIPTAGKHTLALVMSTKNGASSSYYGRLQHVLLRRTDTPAAPKTWQVYDVPTGALLNQNVRDLTAPRSIIDVDVFNGPQSHANWATIFLNAACIYQAARESTGAQNAEISWFVELAAGTWRVDLMHVTHSTRGIYSVRLDDIEQGTIDGYSPGTVVNHFDAVTGIVVATSNYYKLTLTMATKNGASSSYYGSIQGVRLRRTDI